jgi:uncharacterized protein (DUF2384 family)
MSDEATDKTFEEDVQGLLRIEGLSEEDISACSEIIALFKGQVCATKDALRWFVQPNEYFEARRPVDLLRTVEGRERVERALTLLTSGGYY